MKTSLTIDLDNNLLNYTVNYFDNKQIELNYSKIIEEALIYYLNSQFMLQINNIQQNNLLSILQEPNIDLDKPYFFDLSKVEGMWPGNENIDELLELLNN